MTALPTPIQKITHPLLDEKEIQLFVKRDDLIHPEIMGNKWRKLKYNMKAMSKKRFSKLVTMGGAYSNHIAATAAASFELGFQSVGIIRGEELSKDSNPTLSFAQSKGMKLEFVSRDVFRTWRDSPEKLGEKYPNHYFLPEGGTNQLAIEGCKEIVDEISIEFDCLVTPIGTGGTFAGLLSGVQDGRKIIGISCLKGDFIFKEISELLQSYQIESSNYRIRNDYHFGGYGKVNNELIDFINWFKENFGIPLDPIYTGKSFFAVWDMIKTDKFEKNLRIILLHTGGLQGIEGFNRKNENILN